MVSVLTSGLSGPSLSPGKGHFVVLSGKMFYYPTAPRRVQITPKTSTNITQYLYSRGLVRQVSCC